jgi:hypothetical protein
VPRYLSMVIINNYQAYKVFHLEYFFEHFFILQAINQLPRYLSTVNINK